MGPSLNYCPLPCSFHRTPPLFRLYQPQSIRWSLSRTLPLPDSSPLCSGHCGRGGRPSSTTHALSPDDAGKSSNDANIPSFLTSKRHHCKFLIFMMPSVVALNVSLLCLVFLPGGRSTAARSPPPPASSSWGSLPAMAKATLTTKSALFRAFHGASRRAFTL